MASHSPVIDVLCNAYCVSTGEQERTVRALYWKEEPAKRAVMRATYFLRKGGGWVPYSEEDSETLEVRLVRCSYAVANLS